jgi:hypothetical protein
MYVCAMDDTHLINTINLILRPLIAATELINRDLNAPLEKSRRAKYLYGDRPSTMPVESYRTMYRATVERLAPYLFEAITRKLDIADSIQKATGRTSVDLEAPSVLSSCHHNLLRGRVDDDDFEDEWD